MAAKSRKIEWESALKTDIDHYIDSTSEKMVDILDFVADMGEFTTEQIVAHFGFNLTTTKRYLRQLAEFCYLEPHGGNKNRTYSRNQDVE